MRSVIRTKSKSRKKTEKAAPYLRRTLNDERVHKHLADAAGAIHKAYDRVSRRGGAKALEDKKLYDHVRDAAGSLRAAVGLVSRPEPRPKRRVRKALTVLVLAGTGALVVKKVRSRGSDAPRDYSEQRAADPVEPARAAQAA
jgi:hypothetical protein